MGSNSLRKQKRKLEQKKKFKELEESLILRPTRDNKNAPFVSYVPQDIPQGS